MGCDLQSNPSSAAFKALMGNDCLKPTEAWYRPPETPENFLDHYKAVEQQMKKLEGKHKLLPLEHALTSAYKDSIYSHG